MKHTKQKLDPLAFFLGLLEGDGSIQVNHWKKRILQYRIIIKLKFTHANYHMLSELKHSLPCMNLHVRNNYVLLVEDDQRKLKALISLIDKYGLLLHKTQKRYAFFKYCYHQKISYSEYSILKNDFELFSP